MPVFQWLEKTFRRKTTSLAYIPAVDGVRFLAILLVFLFHAAQYFDALWAAPPDLSPVLQVPLEYGHKGVPLFFMLSGFIVSLPFARYYLGSGDKIQLKDYFLRRFIRIEPPYLISMLIFFLIALLHTPGAWKHLSLSLAASCIYLHTIIFHHFPYINGVAWSLELEVQFYCLGPLLFNVFRLPMLLRRTVLALFIFLFSLYPLVRPVSFITLPDYLQFFLAGILISDYYVTGMPGFIKNRLMIPVAFFLLGYMLWLPLYHHRYTMPLFPLTMFGFLMIVLGNAQVKKLFSGRLITLIGGMCYSIYLIHGLLIIYIDEWLFRLQIPGGGYLVNFLLQASLYAIATLIVCSLYFVLVEKPFMTLKIRKTKGAA